MRSSFQPKLLQFSEAALLVADSIRDCPSNRSLHGSLVLGVADALIQYQDSRRQRPAANTPEPQQLGREPPDDFQI